MSWKKHFRTPKQGNPLDNNFQYGGGNYDKTSSSKYSSFLPELYAGHPSRIQRYYQYTDMDRDSDINAALDTIADFCTQSEEQSKTPFFIEFDQDASETEVKLVNEYLKHWIKLNNFKSRVWDIIRKSITFGDQFFIRDPETKEWIWLDHFTVESVHIDNEKGKVPKEYIVRGLVYNKSAQIGSEPFNPQNVRSQYGTTNLNRSNPVSTTSNFNLVGGNRDPRMATNMSNQDLVAIPAEHIIHISLSTGMDINWPFGNSVLEPIFKTFKQKELLEDAIIIYRIQRAPERRIFYIDVGEMPPVLAQAEIERVKNSIHQRRIPNRTGGGSNILDAAYNPLSINDDYFFAQGANSRGSRVETLPGGDNLGEIGDLSFFNNKMARGLRIPPQYLSLGNDDGGGMTYNDGKLGAAVIQEFRFNKYCMKLQAFVAPAFDKDFKKFLSDNGVEIEDELFELMFHPPQNFTKYRQIELDTAQMSVYQQVADNKKLSERFKFSRFLNLTEEEILENERMWKEENPGKLKKATGSDASDEEVAGTDLGSIGIHDTGGFEDFGAEPEPEGETPEGEQGAAPQGANAAPPVPAAPDVGGAPPPA